MTISPGFCFLWALCLLVLPLRWGMGLLLAALTHEIFHCVAVWLCGGQVLSLALGGHGAVIEASPMTPGKDALCALTGPLGSFLMMLIAEYFPEAAVCGLIQGAYNLIPIYPLDGGRVLRYMFSHGICCGVEAFFLILFVGISFWASTFNPELGLITLLAGVFPLIPRKLSCKEPKLAVQ